MDSAGSHRRPPTATATVEEWPIFTGVGAVAAPGAASEQLLVAAYSTDDRGLVQVLDPTSGEYRLVEVDGVRAVSADLRYAVVARGRPLVDSGGGGPLVHFELGILDNVTGEVLGRLAMAPWTDPLGGLVESRVSWSPDGRRIVVCVRRAVPGQGWLAEKLVFVDVRTGSVRGVEIRPSDTMEPVDLLGWTADGDAVVLDADPIGTDQAPSGHLVYDDAGALLANVAWGSQASASTVVGRDELGLTSVDGDRLSVVDIRTGQVLRQHRSPRHGSVRPSHGVATRSYSVRTDATRLAAPPERRSWRWTSAPASAACSMCSTKPNEPSWWPPASGLVVPGSTPTW